MFIYYIVPFIFNNPYPLLQISNSHNTMTVLTWTHVYMNFYDYEGPRKSSPAVMSGNHKSPSRGKV
jgi:hypothetical protein